MELRSGLKSENAAGGSITRTLVSDEDAFLNHALAAAGGSMEGWTEYKPNWWTSPDGRTHIEINMHGHENTNEGPHITVRRLDDTSGRYTAESKTFIQGWEQFKRDWANYDWDKHAENQNK